jgi:hypothetical protein
MQMEGVRGSLGCPHGAWLHGWRTGETSSCRESLPTLICRGHKITVDLSLPAMGPRPAPPITVELHLLSVRFTCLQW